MKRHFIKNWWKKHTKLMKQKNFRVFSCKHERKTFSLDWNWYLNWVDDMKWNHWLATYKLLRQLYYISWVHLPNSTALYRENKQTKLGKTSVDFITIQKKVQTCLAGILLYDEKMLVFSNYCFKMVSKQNSGIFQVIDCIMYKIEVFEKFWILWNWYSIHFERLLKVSSKKPSRS